MINAVALMTHYACAVASHGLNGCVHRLNICRWKYIDSGDEDQIHAGKISIPQWSFANTLLTDL
jgi:hypothetical protein